MKIKDKTIIAFLVSMGLFSSTQAFAYVGSLSLKDKQALFQVANNSQTNPVPVTPSGTDWDPTQGGNNQR